MNCHACAAPIEAAMESCPVCGAAAPPAPAAETPTRELLRAAAAPSGATPPREPRADGADGAGGRLALALHPDFEVIRPLGRGGMGVVYLARDVALDRLVAIKVLLHRDGDATGAERFVREARLAARLAHPGIVPIFRIGQGDGLHYFAMAHVDGETLDGLVARRGPLPREEAARILRDVAAAVSHAHAQGVLHRDLKPQNIMVDRSGRVFVMDFGLAKAPLDASLSGAGVVVGTPQYVSPEQLRGEPATTRSDVYALGLVHAFLRTGEHVVRGDSPSAIVGQHLAGAPRSRIAAEERLPPDERALLSRMLAPDPAARPADLSMLMPLQASSSGTTPTVALPAATPRGRRWVGPVLLLSALLAVVVASRAMLHRDPRRAEAPGGTRAPLVRQVTSSGRAVSPVLSPDGTAIAYVELGAEGHLVIVQDLATGSRITAVGPGAYGTLGFTPDGSELLLLHAPEGRPSGLQLLPRFGGTPRQIPGTQYMTIATFSPDGRRLATTAPVMKKVRLVERASGLTQDLAVPGSFDWLVDVDWSPDGTTLLCQASGSRRSVLLAIDVGGGTSREVLSLQGTRIVDAAWSPRGEGVYYVLQQGSTSALWSIPASGMGGSAPVQILPDVPMSHGKISIAANRLAHTRTVARQHLWTAPLHAPASVRRLTQGTQIDDSPALSPSGDRIAFVRGTGTASSIHVVGVGSGDATRITYGTGAVDSPAWSPDGAQLAFVSDEKGPWLVWRVGATGDDPRPFDDAASSRDIAWSPGQSIVYQTPGNTGLMALDPATGARRSLLPEPIGWVFSPRVAPDGRRVAFYANTGAPSLVTASVDGGDHRVIGSMDVPGFPVAYLSGGKILTSASGSASVEVWDEARCAVERSIEIPLEGAHVVASDGTVLVGTVGESESDVWLVEDFDPGLASPAPPSPRGSPR